ncbi:MAG: hypothetical protein ACJ8AI_14365 [Rhodopila sp.]
MIIAIASSQPLFAKPRPANVEKADAYLRALAAAVKASKGTGNRIVGNALLVETLPKQGR